MVNGLGFQLAFYWYGVVGCVCGVKVLLVFWEMWGIVVGDWIVAAIVGG